MNGESILIVEDESVVALNVSHILRTLGYRPIGPTATGAGALKLLQTESIDIVLMDIKLKGPMDGIELAKQVQEIRRVPIVFLTAYTDEQTLARAKAVAPFGYITKSFDEGELHSTIEMALYKFAMEQKLVNDERLLATTLGSILEGVIRTDAAGRIRYMNPAAVRLTGVDIDGVTGKLLDRLITLLRPSGEVVSPFDISNEEGMILRREGVEIGLPVEWKATRINPFKSRDAETVHVVRDLTARRKAEAAQQRLVSLVEFSDDAIITVTPTTVIESWNSGAAKIFGYSDREAIGRGLTIITPRFVPFNMADTVARVGAGENIEPFELICRKKDGSPVDVAMKLQGIRDYAGSISSVSIIARDVTTRKNLDKKLREMLNREQTRIGQDLHDSIGQMITGILFKTKAMEHRLRSESLTEEAAEISEIKELLSATLLKLRELARGLIPATIRSDGLLHALRQLTRDTKSLSGLTIGFDADERVTVYNELVSSEIYHIVEEALNNAVKHSGCTTITVHVRRLLEEIVVSVADNGCGLPDHIDQKGLGLKIMRHRAELIGAGFSLSSSKAGTRVTCKLPVARAGRMEESWPRAES